MVAPRAQRRCGKRNLVAGRDFAIGIGEPYRTLELVIDDDVDDGGFIETGAIGEIQREQHFALARKPRVGRQFEIKRYVAARLAKERGIAQSEIPERVFRVSLQGLRAWQDGAGGHFGGRQDDGVRIR